MAKALDLEEQEQLDQIKHFWKRYGNLISWVLIVVLGGFASWNGYQYWQRSQAAKAAVLFDEIERSVVSGDLTRVERSLADIKDKFPRTVFAHQAALTAAKLMSVHGQIDEAKAALTWVAAAAPDTAYRDLARLRLAGLLFDEGALDNALAQLSSPASDSLNGLIADLKGDILMAQNQKEAALVSYRSAWKALTDIPDYRRLVEAKLNALGVDPEISLTAGISK